MWSFKSPAEPEEISNLDQEEGEYEPVWDWEGTVELAETDSTPTFCANSPVSSCYT